ncbi:isoprenoid synthase domain-containing protein [Pterulicium gracile]|uniref:Isoprenoid synthase domain-containing protein n=1 Tax=Pterulicium gracile TaxID=1884261 RepID=A0A5C3QEL6_9AGAR|nr:isoprenoid synthase domain-containing protein [Pterula gracilis]
MYPHHPLDVKVYIAIYSWLAPIIDDKASSMLEDLEQFQQRFFSNIPQGNPLLELFAATLRDTHNYFDPIIARFIVLSSLAFLNICLLEIRQEYRDMPAQKGGEKWAYYFRDKEGVCEAYAYLCFPKATCPDISVFLQAIPDMCIAVNCINDLLSFYKEKKAGDVRNYVHKRAMYERKDVVEVMQEMSEETISCNQRVCLVLKGRGAYEQAWLGYVNGYITMHYAASRYKLKEIGVGW